MKDILKKNKKMLVLIILLVITLIGGTYAILRLTLEGKQTNTITVGELSLALKEENAITIKDAYPITDDEGKETTPYTFTLTNDGNVSNNYTVKLVDTDIGDKTRMLDSYVKCRLTIKKDGEEEKETIMNLSELGRVLDSGTLDPDKSIDYSLQLWMDYDAPNDAQGTVFKAKLEIVGEQIVE